MAELADFILSCRAFGRRVEETMLRIAAEHARKGRACIAVRELRRDREEQTDAQLPGALGATSERTGALRLGPRKRVSCARTRDVELTSGSSAAA